MDIDDIVDSFRFCRVCLVPEEDVKFSSIFDDHARVAFKLFALSGVLLVDVDEKVPSLVCRGCIREVEAADVLRKRILDANDHLSMMTATKETEMFKSELEVLKSKVKVEVKEEMKPSIKRERTRSRDEDSSEDFLAPEILSKWCADVKAKVAKSQSNKGNKARKCLPTEAMKDQRRAKDAERKRLFRLRRKLNQPIERKTLIKFECDTCNACFSSMRELNDHISSRHDCKLVNNFDRQGFKEEFNDFFVALEEEDLLCEVPNYRKPDDEMPNDPNGLERGQQLADDFGKSELMKHLMA